MVAAFAGWNDAGDSATSAVRFMQRRWRADTFATIDPEEFYDFTQARPLVRLRDGERVIEWPSNGFASHVLEDHDRDIILFNGTEPHLLWHHYIDTILEVCETFEVSGFVTLAALLAEASHARPVRVSGSSADEDLANTLDLGRNTTSGYEGPTGIVGVLSQAIRDTGIPSASMWANVPFYVQRSPNPKGSLALLERLNRGLELKLTLHDLEVFGARFDAQVQSDIASNPEVAELARRLEDQEPEDIAPVEDGDGELPDAEAMVDELERFLRQQRDDPAED
jgi:hypothetical protein